MIMIMGRTGFSRNTAPHLAQLTPAKAHVPCVVVGVPRQGAGGVKLPSFHLLDRAGHN